MPSHKPIFVLDTVPSVENFLFYLPSESVFSRIPIQSTWYLVYFVALDIRCVKIITSPLGLHHVPSTNDIAYSSTVFLVPLYYPFVLVVLSPLLHYARWMPGLIGWSFSLGISSDLRQRIPDTASGSRHSSLLPSPERKVHAV